MKLGDDVKVVKAIGDTMKHARRFEIAALKTAERLIKSRIHTRGKATDGSKIGNYLKGRYRKMRALTHQVSYIDLSFKGDLIRGYTVGTSGKRNVFGYLTDAERVKIEGNAERLGKDISDASAKELAAMEKAYNNEFNFVLKQKLNALPS